MMKSLFIADFLKSDGLLRMKMMKSFLEMNSKKKICQQMKNVDFSFGDLVMFLTKMKIKTMTVKMISKRMRFWLMQK